jgi:hypothetical protein
MYIEGKYSGMLTKSFFISLVFFLKEKKGKGTIYHSGRKYYSPKPTDFGKH